MIRIENKSSKNIINPKTLFIDRDGVINVKRDNDYVKKIDEFIFKENIFNAFKTLNSFFDIIIVVTNQRGIGRGIMTLKNLNEIHDHMVSELKKNNVKIDMIIYCPYIEEDNFFRKPNPGMAFLAKEEFNNISFKNSVMVGDSQSDIDFGKRLGMETVKICENYDNINSFDSLYSYSKSFKS